MISEALLNHRYELQEELGRGGMGVVYRAHDTLLERAVAVKLLSNAGLGSEGRARLLHEAKAAAALNHPNIVSIFDAGEVDGKSFIIMELLEGESLFERRPKELPEILSIAVQICDALEHAHSHGIVHRDLKLENVIVTHQGQVKLTDFGLARSMTSRISVEGAIVGTVFYLAPEQALGQEIDGRADLYALGVMLYELVAGQLPFTADEPLAVITQHLYSPVIPPNTYAPSLPPALNALILRLLNKQPEDRPSSAAEVRQALDPEQITQASFQPTVAGSALDQLARGRLVGREKELAEIKALWKQAAAGNCDTPVLLLSGESGVGKTPLVREARALAEITGARAFAGECFAEGSAPYSPISEIIRAALSLPRFSLPDRILADLLALAPDIRSRYPQVQANTPLDPAADQQRIFESLVELCSRLTEQRPLLLIIEDVQWADGGAMFLLRHLARRSRALRLRLLILLTYRESEIDEACCLQDVLLDLNRERLAARIKLTRFDRQQTQRLLDVMFQEEVAPELADAIFRETDGNMFFIEEMCKALIEQGRLARVDNRWHLSSPGDLQLPQSVWLAIQARVGKLPAETQDALRLAAIIGREFDFATLLAAGSFPEDDLIEALETAGRAQLIRELRDRPNGRKRADGERFAFEHGLILAALRESVSGLRRHRMHRRVAAAIETLRPDDHEALAYHYENASDAESACRAYQRAAEKALGVYANQEAERYLRAALDLTEAAADRASLLARLGEALFRQSRYQDAVNAWVEALPLCKSSGDYDTLARLHARAARAAWYAGDAAHGLALCLDGRAALPPGLETAGVAALLHETARAYRFNQQNEQALPLCHEALAMAQRLNLVEVQAETFATLGIIPTQTPEARRAALEQAVQLAESAGLLAAAARSHLNISGYFREIGDQAQARRHNLRAIEIAEKIGIVAWQHDFTVNAIEISLDMGDLPAAEQLIQRLSALTERIPQNLSVQFWPTFFTARLARFRGQWSQAERDCRALHKIAAPTTLDVATVADLALADVLVEAERDDEADEYITAVLAANSEVAHENRAYANFLRLQTALRRGDLPTARQRMAEIEESLANSSKQNERATALWAQARLAAAELRFADRDAAFSDAIAAFEQLGQLWFTARARLDWGEALLASGQPVDRPLARSHFENAQREFAAMDAPLLAERAQAGLSACSA